jgi:hypothetical protein
MQSMRIFLYVSSLIGVTCLNCFLLWGLGTKLLCSPEQEARSQGDYNIPYIEEGEVGRQPASICDVSKKREARLRRRQQVTADRERI